MIKLIDYRNDEKGKIVFINKSCIGGMIRKEQEGLTRLWDNGVTEFAAYDFKETPEEILAMPDIQEGNKTIDWEQRRYEIAKHILSKTFILGSPNGSANNAVRFADALIETLKGGEK
mgnify:CR=1 FL=1